MPEGLQCFNAQGAIVVDLTDKHLTLFKQLTIKEAIGNITVSQYFGSTDVGAELTMMGISNQDTVAYVTPNQIGTAINTVLAMIDVAVVITGPNKYRMAIMEHRPSDSTMINFYKFR